MLVFLWITLIPGCFYKVMNRIEADEGFHCYHQTYFRRYMTTDLDAHLTRTVRSGEREWNGMGAVMTGEASSLLTVVGRSRS